MAVDHNNPQSRDEEILIATIDGKEYNKLPQSRMEELLLELKETIEQGGGGGTSDYENLTNQPQVNGETLIGDKTGADLGLVDVEEGKGLSTNDYDDNEKAAVAASTSAISAMKDGTDLDSFGDVEVALLDKANISDLGTAAAKDSTNAVTSGSTNLVESGAVKDAIDSAVSSAYHHAGTKTVSQLTHDLLVAANEGNVYNITDSGTTTSDFIEGIGKTIDEGSNVGICKVGNVYMFDLLSGFVDTTNFVQKSSTAGLLKNDGTVDTTIQGDVVSLKSGFTNLDNEVNGDATVYPYADVITIPDAVPSNLADCSVKIEPIQDLHGQRAPYVGGAGKNKLPLTVDAIKALNTNGTWSGNVYTVTEGTVEILADNANNVVGIKVNITAGADRFVFALAALTNYSGYSYILNGCPSGGSSNAFEIQWWINNVGTYQDFGDGVTVPLIAENKSNSVSIIVRSGYTANNLIFYPMIHLATETDATFAPYTNVCPITGHTEASVQRVGRNLLNPVFEQGSSLDTGSTRIRCKNTILVESGKTYTFSASDYTNYKYSIDSSPTDSYPFDSAMLQYVGNPSGWNTQAVTFTATNSGYVAILVSKSDNSSIAPNDISGVNLQIELGSSATDYEPYQGKTYTIALGDTIYGGTVDFDSGVMTVTHGINVVRSNNIDGETALSNNITRFRCVLSIDILSGGANSVCSHFPYLESWDDPTPHFYTQTSYAYCFAPGNGAQEVKAYIEEQYNAGKPITICSKLKNTFTVQLTAQQIQLLKGTNTLTASTGQISVTVNGVSGAIGQVQEQVNELGDRLDTLDEYVLNTPVKIGKWLGSDLYRKVISFGSLPDNNYWAAQSGLSNVAITNIRAFARSANATIMLNYPDCKCYYNHSNDTVVIATSADFSSYTSCYVVLEYYEQPNS